MKQTFFQLIGLICRMAIDKSHPFYVPSSMSKGLCFSIYGK